MLKANLLNFIFIGALSVALVCMVYHFDDICGGVAKLFQL